MGLIAELLSSCHMSSPDSFTLELNATPVHVVSAVTEAQHMLPPELGWLSLNSTQTVRVDLDSGTLIEGGEDEEGGIAVGLGATPPSSTEEGRSEEAPP